MGFSKPRLILLPIYGLGAFLIVTIFYGKDDPRIWTNTWYNVSNPILKRESQNRASPIISTKWIVVTSISPPTQQIATLSKIHGWQLLVVADQKTPLDWNAPGAILLSVEAQHSLGYGIVSLLPWNSYTRKMIGYLYAIQHGAQYIYDTDDDNAPNEGVEFEKGFVLTDTMKGLTLIPPQDRGNLINPYVHFGQKSIWPRGFPLDQVGVGYNNTYKLCVVHTPLIQQGLVNGDPDVDAVYRLTQKSVYSPLNVKFDGFAPPLIYPEGLLAPFNSQNTLFHYAAFWGMLLPTTVTFRVTDIWRGYWAQRLLWEIGGTLAFLPPRTTQIRNNHTYLKDFVEEDQMYKESSNFAKLLTEWKCHEDSLYSCILSVTKVMVDAGLISDADLTLTHAWLDDLISIGYDLPDLVHRPSPCIDRWTTTHAIFTGQTEDVKPEIDTIKESTLRKLCNLSAVSTENRTASAFPTTLLVVTYNHPHYDHMWILDAIYRPHFANILYCGAQPNSTNASIDSILAREEFVRSGATGISFVYANVNADPGSYPPEHSPNGAGVTNGFFVYECAIRAVEMGYRDLTGYMVIGDDVLFNFWNNGKYDANEAWLYHKYAGLLDTVTPVGWWWWPYSIFGVNATIAAFNEIYEDHNPYVVAFREQRESFGYNRTTAMYGWTDAYYFPAAKSEMLYEVGVILRENIVFLEIVVPFWLNGLSSPEKFVILPGAYNGGYGSAARDHPFDYYKVEESFMHSVKLSGVITNATLRGLYCHNFIEEVLKYSPVY
ncbi:uncharacterized protein LOC110860763 [Folsomia candida]|uniref:uncharacterized protein LOC110860763 n=1 Tax=Folsomia candida TaxID=158441 RepID=UPI000B8FC257|nr:uncharacterized protein LOC110860763 [Folsomia candida]